MPDSTLPGPPRARTEASAAFFELILREIDTDIVVLDTELRYEYVNPVAVRDPTVRDWIIGKDDVEYIRYRGEDPSVAENRQRHLRRALETREANEFDETLVESSGERRHFLRRILPVVGPDGEVERLICYGVDVTALRRTADALRESEGQLRQAQKMDAIGRMAGGIAHDFNNLLTAVRCNAELVLASLTPHDPNRSSLEEIGKAAARAASLTGQLLAFGRKQVLQPRIVDLNVVVGDMEKMLRRLMGDTVTFDLKLAPDLGAVRADPVQFAQVLLNLAVNARDAMPDGGCVTIETRNVDLGQHDALVAGVDPGRQVLVAVSDTGMGIDDNVKEHIFEPFFTTKGQGQGTGLGLSTVYGIVAQSGGRIRVISAPGKGSRFEVYLPRLEQRADAAASSSRPTDHIDGDETILLVEDEKSVRALAERILSRRGYRVLAAPNADEATALFDQHRSEIDILVTDVIMPGRSGRELADMLRQEKPGLAVLYMSGYHDDELLRRGLAGDDARRAGTFLQKPFTPDSLVQSVRVALDGATRR